MPPGQFGKGVVVPAENFGYQFLVGFVAQTLPCPSERRATQHNCLLIRTDSPTVTGVRRIYARFGIALATILYVFTTLYVFSRVFRIAPCSPRKLLIGGERDDPREKFSSSRPGGRIVVRVFVSRGHLPDEIRTGRLNFIRRDVAHIGKWIAERLDYLAR